jgi:hypothetical protein
MGQGRGGKMLLGMGLLHVVCCGLPLLLAAGALGGVGALLSSPLLLAAGALGVLAVVGLAVRRMRAGQDADCCTPSDVTPRAEDSDLVERRLGA